MWASQDEYTDRFMSETFAPVDFRIRDAWDNGEFLTGATVDLYLKGQIVGTETFIGSMEFADNDGTALRQASSFAWAWVEIQEYSMEERLAPFGIEWQREREEVAA